MPDELKKQVDPEAQGLDQILNVVHQEGREALSKDLEKAAAPKGEDKQVLETPEKPKEEKREASKPEGTPPKEEPKKEDVAPKPKRFQTVEEYERALEDRDNAYKEVQAVASRQGEEINRLKRTVDNKKDEEDWLKKVEESEKVFEEYLSTRTGQTIEAIDALDEADPEYDLKVRKIRAAEYKDVIAYQRKHPELTSSIPVKQQERQSAPQEIPPDVKEKAEKVISEEARKHGIDPLSPKFREFCAKSPDKLDGKELSFNEQLGWAIEQTKDYFVSQWRPGKKEETPAPPQKGNGADKGEIEAPMGKGAAFAKPKAEESFEPVSIEKALQSVRQQRTL